jgi:uncharacterized lipoprotein YajG
MRAKTRLTRVTLLAAVALTMAACSALSSSDEFAPPSLMPPSPAASTPTTSQTSTPAP